MKLFIALALALAWLTGCAHLGHQEKTDFSQKKTYQLNYTVTIPAQKEAGDTFSLWVPYPASNSAQEVLSSQIESAFPMQITKEQKHGNTVIFISGQSPKKETTVNMVYKVSRSPYKGVSSNNLNQKEKRLLRHYKKPTPLIPFYPTIKKMARTQSRGVYSQDKVVKKFYDHLYEIMSYDKSGDGWGRGDAVWACDAKRGNCTDFHSLYMALNRYKGIPARFVMGVPIHKTRQSSDIPGYHCWAEVFVKGQGWVPVDISNAKKEGVGDKYFGYLPSDRIEFSKGRDLVFSPKQKGKPLNYFIFPYAEVNGKKTKFKHKIHYRLL